MKKTKFISVLSTIVSIGSLAPMTTIITSCNKDKEVKLSEQDIAFLNEINEAIAPLQFEGVPFKAVHAVKNSGINIFEHKFSNLEFELILNMADKKFGILYKDTIYMPDSKSTNFDKNRVWKFVDKYDPTSLYAQHLNDNFKFDATQTLEVTGCVDTGTNTNIKSIKYVGTSSKKEVYIRTYTEFLTIEPQEDDTIHHFHYADNVYVNGTGSSHYLEYGRSCYLRAHNTRLSFSETATRDEPSAVDVFEPVGSETVTIVEQAKDTNVYTKIGSGTTKGNELTIKYKDAPTYTVANITELKQKVSSSCLIRLTSDITLTNEDACSMTIGNVGGTKVNIVLDLNGHTIDTSRVTTTFDSIFKIVNGTFVLLDTKGFESNAKITGNQHITVAAENENDLARFIIDGGKIEFTTDSDKPNPAITVGKNDTNDEYHSEFYMYGGSLKMTCSHKIAGVLSPAIKISNGGSYIYTVYGDIYGSHGAIVTDEGGGSGTTRYESHDSTIEVFGGNFTCDDDHICINLRRDSEFIVYGGYFKGGSAIGCVNANLVLNGGMFVATGDVVNDFYKQEDATIYQYNNYLVANGSVIACYWHTDTHSSCDRVSPPSIISNNVKMYSYKGNILHMGSEKTLFPETEFDKSWIEFISGCYYFNVDAAIARCPNGMVFDAEENKTQEKFEWLQKGLWQGIKF